MQVCTLKVDEVVGHLKKGKTGRFATAIVKNLLTLAMERVCKMPCTLLTVTERNVHRSPTTSQQLLSIEYIAGCVIRETVNCFRCIRRSGVSYKHYKIRLGIY